MQWLTISRNTVFGLMSFAGLIACGDSSTPSSTSDNSVDAAYSALVSEAAGCGKQVKSCLEAATDRAALVSCREQFSSCRVDAGKKALNALAGAVRDCTSQHNQCVHAGGHGEAGSCQDDLRVCLRGAHAANHADDADAGDDDKSGSKPSDCLDQLHSCVTADGAALSCAEKVRACVVDCIPNASDVVPDDDGKTSDSPKGERKPMSASRMCVDELSTCMDSGTAARSCAKSLLECHAAAKP